MNDKKIRKLVFAALLAALVCVATMVVQIPSPMQGYVNLGDCFVLLSGWLLGPWYGFAAGGIGSMLADLFLGYAHYAPGTLVIKGLVALLAALLYEKLGRSPAARIASGVVGEIVNVLPQPKAGSSFATAAYRAFRHPVALEEIRADAGLDIGGTLIGMHLKKVAVPVRLAQKHIGQAILLAARTRPKFIGGERAIYDESLKEGYPDFAD